MDNAKSQVKWYAVQTQPNREFPARGALQAKPDVGVFLPTVRVTPVNPRARKERPFFPGYLFVQANLDQVGLSAIQWTPGVVRLLGYGGAPSAIPDHLIAEIRKRVSQVQQEGPLILGQLKHGDRVRIASGPFEGYEGMFDVRANGHVRARVLVEFLGRVATAELDVRILEKVKRSSHAQEP